ncbi:MAG: transaldolase family protein [Flavobacteriales bacterium]
MELYLDSVNLEEIKKASRLGYLTGLTTTPTFMVKEGVKDVDALLLELAKYMNILQVEALGDSAEAILDEAHRLLALGLDKNKTVFKIPISMEGTRACKMLIDQGMMVNLHLVYTLQQAYMALSAGATYVCPLVGRLQDQGHDALGLVEQCVDTVERYGYATKIMFSSVRYAEHIRNALAVGAHTITVPWKVLEKLTDNHFTTIGTDQFISDTRVLTTTVGHVMQKEHVSISQSSTIAQALIEMTKSKIGAVAVLKPDGSLFRVFTDGDLRRLIQQHGDHVHDTRLETLGETNPMTIDANVTLFDAQKMFNQHSVDTLVAMQNGRFAGLIDVQHII